MKEIDHKQTTILSMLYKCSVHTYTVVHRKVVFAAIFVSAWTLTLDM